MCQYGINISRPGMQLAAGSRLAAWLSGWYQCNVMWPQPISIGFSWLLLAKPGCSQRRRFTAGQLHAWLFWRSAAQLASMLAGWRSWPLLAYQYPASYNQLATPQLAATAGNGQLHLNGWPFS